MREAQLAQYNYILVVGETEAATGQVRRAHSLFRVTRAQLLLFCVNIFKNHLLAGPFTFSGECSSARQCSPLCEEH